jgi:hypothetical protein
MLKTRLRSPLVRESDETCHHPPRCETAIRCSPPLAVRPLWADIIGSRLPTGDLFPMGRRARSARTNDPRVTSRPLAQSINFVA